MMELLLQVLCQSTRAVAIWVIHGDEGMGDTQVYEVFRGVCRFCTTETRLTQELRLGV